jgi:hypothetical protein
MPSQRFPKDLPRSSAHLRPGFLARSHALWLNLEWSQHVGSSFINSFLRMGFLLSGAMSGLSLEKYHLGSKRYEEKAKRSLSRFLRKTRKDLRQ